MAPKPLPSLRYFNTWNTLGDRTSPSALAQADWHDVLPRLAEVPALTRERCGPVSRSEPCRARHRPIRRWPGSVRSEGATASASAGEPPCAPSYSNHSRPQPHEQGVACTASKGRGYARRSLGNVRVDFSILPQIAPTTVLSIYAALFTSDPHLPIVAPTVQDDGDVDAPGTPRGLAVSAEPSEFLSALREVLIYLGTVGRCEAAKCSPVCVRRHTRKARRHRRVTRYH